MDLREQEGDGGREVVRRAAKGRGKTGGKGRGERGKHK